ncbi:hypothetical protein BDD12DRAFT_808730 [Trichophaea hybrida]|nr:hypothetical protein BDD12DRAFT_808730 [Trichophaea hybrida]
MDIFTDVSDSAFRTWDIFHFPQNGDSVKAVAFSRDTSQKLIVAYSIALTFIIMMIWDFIVLMILACYDVQENSSMNVAERRRGMAAVGLLNSREPFQGLMFTVEYISAVISAKAGRTVIGPAVGLFFIALCCVVAGNAVNILVAGNLEVGNLAPARPSSVYIPDIRSTNNEDRARFQAILGPATLRAIGSSEAAEVTVRKRLNIVSKLSVTEPGDVNPHFALNYNYSITGRDMGLQQFPEFRQDVIGSCETAYDWFQRYESGAEIYHPWGNQQAGYKVLRDGEANSPPRAQAINDPSIPTNSKTIPSQRRFGIIIYSVGRSSYRSSTDAWYYTEAITNVSTSDKDAPRNKVRTNRPPLSCWQNDTWIYNGQTYKNINEASDALEGVFPRAWLLLLQFHFIMPKIISITNSAGASALTSSMTFVGTGFDAAASTVEDELKRLLVATFISSSHVFRNSLMTPPQIGTANLAQGSDGQPQAGVANFVVSTPQVTALRFSILIAVPATFFALMLLGVIKKILKLYGRGGAGLISTRRK